MLVDVNKRNLDIANSHILGKKGKAREANNLSPTFNCFWIIDLNETRMEKIFSNA